MKDHTFTSQRKLLLDIIHKADRHINAREIYQRACSKDYTVSLATVYRSLSLFKEMGLIEEMQLGHQRCYHEAKNTIEHQHLVCKNCGKIIEFQSPLITKLISRVQDKYSFQITKTTLFLEGQCPQCTGSNNVSS